MTFTEEFINNLEIKINKIVDRINKDLQIQPDKISKTINLLKEGNTIPFISRYRKEIIGFLNEEQVRDISHKLISYENLESRRIEIIKSIFNRGLLTEELYNNILKAGSLVELEELYAPFKKKKKTRGMIAIEKGLELLSELMTQIENIEEEALKFIDPEKGVNTVEEALQGAMDIIAEKISHDIDNRNSIKEYIFYNGSLVIEGLMDKEKSVYQMYYDYKESFKEIKSHRILAINRGENEGELKVGIDFDEEECEKILLNKVEIKNKYHEDAIKDGLKRLLIPSINRELRSMVSDEADSHGIDVFSKNLNSLLMQPPIKKTKILGIDPGIRTGSKGAILDTTGKFLGYFVIHQEKTDESKNMLKEYISKYNVELIAIGNGTGSYEVQQLVSQVISEYDIPVQYTVVDEDGASVYSASEIARDEFPNLDLTIRGAISIGRRLQDPLAELVKIDPKSIGVGLYQHDVNQSKLSDALDEVVGSVVNNIGVNLNTASFSLLKYVSGINTGIAKNIVRYRDEKGLIGSREELRKINGIGEKVFEQSAGFLKIQESSNPLDNTWVHPENYKVATEIYSIMKKNNELSIQEKQILMEKYNVSGNLIDEIITELKKPNLDPREDFPKPIFQKGVITFDDLTTGMKVTGKIKNVVDFGAFVNIGIKETALLHISEISNKYIKNPYQHLKVGDIKEFQIISIDPIRRRISLSMKNLN